MICVCLQGNGRRWVPDRASLAVRLPRHAGWSCADPAAVSALCVQRPVVMEQPQRWVPLRAPVAVSRTRTALRARPCALPATPRTQPEVLAGPSCDLASDAWYACLAATSPALSTSKAACWVVAGYNSSDGTSQTPIAICMSFRFAQVLASCHHF